MLTTSAGGCATNEFTRPGHDGHDQGPVWLAPPQLPPWPVVWFSVDDGGEDGAGCHAIRRWEFAVDDGRSGPGPGTLVVDPGDRGGRSAWERFVAQASEIMERVPHARWVHYASREPRRLRECVAAYGAPAGFLERLEEALFELLPRGVLRCVRLPLRSHSLEEVAAVAGFHGQGRDLDPGAVVASGAERLLAMRAIWRWMLEQGPKDHCG